MKQKLLLLLFITGTILTIAYTGIPYDEYQYGNYEICFSRDYTNNNERKALEITSKIRSTNDPQQMLQITLEELKRNLGITDGQIIINLPGGEQQDGNTRPLQPSQP
jgi:hypothetical protein